jgi:ParB family chromosome partitioning protein
MEENNNNTENKNTVITIGKEDSTDNRPIIRWISPDYLFPFKDHPFKLYKKDEQRYIDMLESVKAHGVLVPIIARLRKGSNLHYEILSGHNRVEAAKVAGRKEVPVFVQEGLTDEEALLVVTETNLIQRSFADMKPSERALALTRQYEAMMHKSAYRRDLLREIDGLLGAPVGHRMRTRDKLSDQQSLGKTTVARYLRVYKLIAPLQERLDNDEIGLKIYLLTVKLIVNLTLKRSL